jgi:hypothetical protein
MWAPYCVTLADWFHVLKPMPRALLEHGGSENPVDEVRLDNTLQQDQENWVRAESVVELLGQTGFPSDRVTLKFGHEDDIAHTILIEAGFG